MLLYMLTVLQVLLVPPTDFLINARDRDTGLLYADLVENEEFISSHVIRIPGGLGPVPNAKDLLSLRQDRNRARQYATLDGKTVVVKETFVYSNKGFKRFAQAQLLADEICYTDAAETPQWLIYYISKPLVGQADPASIPTAPSYKSLPPPPLSTPKTPAFATASQQPSGDTVKTLNDLLNRFPTIARHMQPGLEKLFQEFTADVAKGTPVQTPATGQDGEEADDRLERTSSAVSTSSRASSFMGRTLTRTATVLDAEENHLRGLAETLVMSAIDV